GNRRIVVQSFHGEVVVEAAMSAYATAFLTERPEDLENVDSLPGLILNVRHDLADRRLIDHCRSVGKKLGVWTANADADLLRMAKLGVEFITTDRPIDARELIG